MPYSCEQMFALVNNIDDYHLFLNWCSHSRILKQNEQEIIGEITVEKGIFKHSFTTINTLSTNRLDMALKEGPFETLTGVWLFKPLRSTGCKVSLELLFSFSNKLMDISLSPIFSHIAGSQLFAFIARAKVVYGAQSIDKPVDP